MKSNEHNVFHKGYNFIIDKGTKTISVPQSCSEEDYPQEVKDLLETRNYYKQLNIL